MATVSNQSEIPPIVGRMLRQVRRQIRAYVWLEGLAKVAVVLGAAFWIGLLLDWWLEPPPVVRVLSMLAVAAGGLWVADRQLVQRLLKPLTDRSLAALLERRFPRLDDHVLTSVDLAAGDSVRDYHPELVSRTYRAAAKAMANVRTRELFRGGPLLKAVTLAVLLIGPIPLFAIAAGDQFQFWMQRLALSSQTWPRRVQLEVAGFPADADGRRTQKIAEDDSFELTVRADARQHEIPDHVELRFRLADGRRGRDTMIRVGEAVPGRDDYQLFRYEFKQVAADMTIEVVGGDDRVQDLYLQLVERPELIGMEIVCDYPEYLGRPQRRLPVTGGMRIPEGTELTLHAITTKPLENVRIHSAHESQDVELSSSELSNDQVTWDYGILDQDDVLTLDITDTDGITCREPYRVSLSVITDELPQLAVRLEGIGSAITPNAVLPLVGTISDDYGLKQAWFTYHVDSGEPTNRFFREQPTNEQTTTALEAFDTRSAGGATGDQDLQLEPGQTLYLSVHATDWCDLGDGPREGASQRFALEVVTEAQLLAMLERRELELRQRYEAVFAKMADTRNLLGRVEFVEAGADSGSDATENATAAADAADTGAASVERARARRRLRVAGSLQNVTQSAHEILGIAQAFDDIHQQLENNRIDNVDLKSRLREQISAPLRQLGEVRMSKLEAQLELVQEHITDPVQGSVELDDGIKLADEVLVEMQQILNRMLELESYHEVVALLRGIIRDQQQLGDKTKQRQADRLRALQD